MKYLVDTDICIYIMNQRPGGVIKKFRQFEPGEIGISAITVSELRYGAAKSTSRVQNEIRLEEFMAPLEILAYDQAAAGLYGEIRFQLEKHGRPIGPLDMLIAAHAISQERVLVTNNEKEFGRIKELKIENWAK